jgi:hypothetical protein
VSLIRRCPHYFHRAICTENSSLGLMKCPYFTGCPHFSGLLFYCKYKPIQILVFLACCRPNALAERREGVVCRVSLSNRGQVPATGDEQFLARNVSTVRHLSPASGRVMLRQGQTTLLPHRLRQVSILCCVYLFPFVGVIFCCGCGCFVLFVLFCDVNYFI